MVTRWGISAAFGVLLSPAAGLAQQAPVPLYPGAMPKTYEAQPLPPVPSAPDYAAPAAPQPPPYAGGMPPMPRSPLPPPMSAPPMSSPPMSSPAAAMPAPLFPPAPQPSTTGAPVSPSADRTFCSQPVSIHVANRDTVGQRYQPFIGIWSDASWTPSLCAALIVENVTPDGTATIVYAFGPMGSNTRAPGGVLHGTGVVRDGELRFQNSDGSQFSFRPLYSDLDGRLTTPQGQTLGAVFKRSL